MANPVANSKPRPADSSGPSPSMAVVTPADGTVQLFRGIYIGGTGDLTVIGMNDSTTTLFSAIPVGTFLPIAVKEVRSTGTTATLIVGLR